MTQQQRYMAQKIASIHEIQIEPAEKGAIYISSINKRGKRILCYKVKPTGKTELLFEKVLTK
jgi:hypothetical protein